MDKKEEERGGIIINKKIVIGDGGREAVIPLDKMKGLKTQEKDLQKLIDVINTSMRMGKIKKEGDQIK